MNSETIYTLFELMDKNSEDIDAVLGKITVFPPEEYDYIRDNFQDFVSIWKYHRVRRIEEAINTIEMKKDLSGKEVLDYYNHLPANDDF